MASRLKTEFGVSDRRWYFTKIAALAKLGEWAELKRFSEEKRSPVGYVPFADAYMRAGRAAEASQMIALIRSEDERLDKLEENGEFVPAALLAIKLGDPRRVAEIYSACGSQQMQAEVQMLAKKAGISLG